MSSQSISGSAFSLTNESGRVCAQLTFVEGAPALVFFDQNNEVRLRVGLTPQGLPQVFLHGLPGADATLKVECDPLGGHVLLNNGKVQQSYLFLKNTGASGLVLFGVNGQRQAEVLVDPALPARWTLWDSAGNVTAASAPQP
jgi:hypothetical protein